MSFKDCPYWLKGGIIGGLIALVYVISVFFIGSISAGRGIPKFLELLLSPYLSTTNFWCNTFVFPKCVGDNCGCNILTPSIIFMFLLILIGILIGWIIEKIKR